MATALRQQIRQGCAHKPRWGCVIWVWQQKGMTRSHTHNPIWGCQHHNLNTNTTNTNNSDTTYTTNTNNTYTYTNTPSALHTPYTTAPRHHMRMGMWGVRAMRVSPFTHQPL